MKTKTIVISLAVALGLIGLMQWGRSNQTASLSSSSPSDASATLAAAEKFYDFGTISMANGNVTKDFTFANPSRADVTVRSVETSCMCTSALLVKPDGQTVGPFGMAGMGGINAADELVKAGESRTLRVIYNPNAHGPAGVGPIDRFITLTDSNGGTLRFEIKAVVTP